MLADEQASFAIVPVALRGLDVHTMVKGVTPKRKRA